MTEQEEVKQCPWQCPICGGRCGGWDGHPGEHECPNPDHPRVPVKKDADPRALGKLRGLKIRLQKGLRTFMELEGKSKSKSANRVRAVLDEDLFDALLEDHGFERREAARLIGVLLKDGVIYLPRPGYYKRTVPPSSGVVA